MLFTLTRRSLCWKIVNNVKFLGFYSNVTLCHLTRASICTHLAFSKSLLQKKWISPQRFSFLYFIIIQGNCFQNHLVINSKDERSLITVQCASLLPASSLDVPPLVHHSLHRGRLECVCNHFQCIFLQQQGNSDSNTKCLQWLGEYA